MKLPTKKLASVINTLLATWTFLVIIFFSLLPQAVCLLAGLSWILFFYKIFKHPRRFRIVFSCFVLAQIIHQLKSPTDDRNWVESTSRTANISFENNIVEIRDFRNFLYPGSSPTLAHWETRRFDLNELSRLDFVIEPFSSWRGLAHTFLTFTFNDGQNVSISVEVRNEIGEDYSPIAGLFNEYELIYVIGDERDLIGLRTNIRQDPVYLLPIKATPGQVRHVFVSMLKRAQQLKFKPEFYNSLYNTCTTNIVRHLDELTGTTLPFDWRVVFPGYADGLAWDLGLIDFEGTLDEARQQFLINDRSAFGTDTSSWSQQIRMR